MDIKIYKLDKEKIKNISDVSRGKEYRAAIKDFFSFFATITKTEITQPKLDSLPKETQEMFIPLTEEELKNSRLFMMAEDIIKEEKND